MIGDRDCGLFEPSDVFNEGIVNHQPKLTLLF